MIWACGRKRDTRIGLRTRIRFDGTESRRNAGGPCYSATEPPCAMERYCLELPCPAQGLALSVAQE